MVINKNKTVQGLKIWDNAFTPVKELKPLCRKIAAEGSVMPLGRLAFQASQPKGIKHKKTLEKSRVFLYCSLLNIDYGPLEGIRTPDLQNRNLLRYPAAPRAVI